MADIPTVSIDNNDEDEVEENITNDERQIEANAYDERSPLTNDALSPLSIIEDDAHNEIDDMFGTISPPKLVSEWH